jgi:hypothetical protein
MAKAVKKKSILTNDSYQFLKDYVTMLPPQVLKAVARRSG